jgi:hypothetical protein
MNNYSYAKWFAWHVKENVDLVLISVRADSRGRLSLRNSEWFPKKKNPPPLAMGFDDIDQSMI